MVRESRASLKTVHICDYGFCGVYDESTGVSGRTLVAYTVAVRGRLTRILRFLQVLQPLLVPGTPPMKQVLRYGQEVARWVEQQSAREIWQWQYSGPSGMFALEEVGNGIMDC